MGLVMIDRVSLVVAWRPRAVSRAFGLASGAGLVVDQFRGRV